MGKKREKHQTKTSSSKTLPSSLTHSFSSSSSSSSSSSDFEFTISLSPRTNSFNTTLCPADELFYKGQLLPLHLSPRISMVRTLLQGSSSSSSSGADTSRASTSSSTTDSSRPSSATDDDDLLRRALNTSHIHSTSTTATILPKKKYFSLAKISSVFKKENNNNNNNNKNKESDVVSGQLKSMGYSAREVISKYLKKIKPFYDKVSKSSLAKKISADVVSDSDKTRLTSGGSGYFSQSFSGNLRYPISKRMGGHVSSCPPSMRSSPIHSGLLCRNIINTGYPKTTGGAESFSSPSPSSMEDLQSAIQGAIAHCKNSLLQKQQLADPIQPRPVIII